MALPENSYSEKISKAELALINEDWQTALDLYNSALDLIPASDTEEIAEALNGRGVALLQLGNFPEALDNLKKTIDLKPDMAGAYFNTALCYEGLEELDQALNFYGKVLELEPSDAEAYFRRGGVHFILREFAHTVEDATQAILLHSGEVVPGPLIARGLANHQLERYQDALDDFSLIIDTDPALDPDAYFYRALVYLDSNLLEPARADLQAFLIMTGDPDGLLGTQAREIIEELDSNIRP